jgi:hypothetical protein
MVRFVVFSYVVGVVVFFLLIIVGAYFVGPLLHKWAKIKTMLARWGSDARAFHRYVEEEIENIASLDPQTIIVTFGEDERRAKWEFRRLIGAECHPFAYFEVGKPWEGLSTPIALSRTGVRASYCNRKAINIELVLADLRSLAENAILETRECEVNEFLRSLERKDRAS